MDKKSDSVYLQMKGLVLVLVLLLNNRNRITGRFADKLKFKGRVASLSWYKA